MRRNPLHKDALRRAHDKISRLIAEAAEPEAKRHIVWDNRASARGDEEEDVWEMWLDDEISQVSFLDDRYGAFVVADLNGTGRNGRRRCEVFNSMREVFNFAAKVDFYLVYVEGDRLMIERYDHDGTGTYVVYGVTEADRVDIEDKAYWGGREGDGSFDYAGFDDLVYCAFTENDPKAKKIFDGVAKPLGNEVKRFYGWS